jgi:hypothetical protein
MAGEDRTSEHLKEYLRRLSPQVRHRLLTELERLHPLGEDVSHSDELIATLRAEFRDTGQSHYRLGNPCHFFQLLELVLVNKAPERANSGQIARGSLGPIWSLITEKLLPSQARDYIESAKKAILANNLREAQNTAAAFQKKIGTYLVGVLRSAESSAAVRTELEIYTSSHATFDDLLNMLHIIRAQQPLAEFTTALPPNILEFEGESFAKVVRLLDTLGMKSIDAVPFALTIVAGRLKKPWQLIRLATQPGGSRAISRIEAAPYAIAVSMVLDQIDDRRLMLLQAFKSNRTTQAKEILSEIYQIDEALRACIDLRDSDWGNRLQILLRSVRAALDSEVSTIHTDRLLKHVLESVKPHPGPSWKERMGQTVRKGRGALVGS